MNKEEARELARKESAVKPCYVNVFRNSEGYYGIGYSNEPSLRLDVVEVYRAGYSLGRGV